MTREEAIKHLEEWKECMSIAYRRTNKRACLNSRQLIDMAIEALSAETHEIHTETHGVCSDLIRRAEAIEAVRERKFQAIKDSLQTEKWYEAINEVLEILSALPSEESVHIETYRELYEKYVNLKHASADAVQGWRTDKPTKQGEYMVTVDSMRHGMVELMYYGKPMMPNRKVRGKCWYRSDDEWGDVVYDDADILAWMPLPKPYRKDGEA